MLFVWSGRTHCCKPTLISLYVTFTNSPSAIAPIPLKPPPPPHVVAVVEVVMAIFVEDTAVSHVLLPAINVVVLTTTLAIVKPRQ
jgi:hypothetical protein